MLWSGRASLPTAAPAAVPVADAPAAVALPSFADVVAAVRPGVVAVRATGPVPALLSRDGDGSPELDSALGGRTTLPANEPKMRRRSGSGFVRDAAGLIVTCRHVVAGSERIDVVVPGHGEFAAELVGEDFATDLALLRLLAPPPGLVALRIDDGDSLRAGDWIVVLGNPLGFAQTASAGIVSFVGRHLPHSDCRVTNDFLQVSAPVHVGSSGGPVVDLRGHVVGVTTQAPVDTEGIAFAVPSATLRWSIEAMLREPLGRVRRGYLGIEFTTSLWSKDGAATTPRGVVIVDVVEGQPAHQAGLRKGDVVLSVDGHPIRDAKALHDRIVCSHPGKQLALQLLRDGRVHDPIVATLGEVGPRRADSAN
jgi:serine protease Do